MTTQIPWHTLSVDEVVSQQQTNATRGLPTSEIKERLKKFGNNALPEPKKRSFFFIFLHQFLNPLIYLLLVAAGIAFFISEPKDAIVILVVVFLNSVLGAYQEGRAEHSLLALRRLSRLKARVLREGQEFLIEANELVPGDLLLLNAGDAVPADARLIEASSVAAAESALTGESVPTSKSLAPLKPETPVADRHNMVYAGTYITAGRGRGIVVTTGISSEIGRIADLATSTVQPKTQLELQLQQLGKSLVIGSLFIFAAVLGLGLWRKIPFVQIFMIAISQMVSLVPEGLPVAVTIALAVGVQRMARRGTIVRRLTAVETLGATTIICSDKTGTLTRNEMTVTKVYLPGGDRKITVSGLGYTPEGEFTEHTTDKTLKKLFEICCLCNDAKLLAPDLSKSSAETSWRILGDPTEGALLTFAAKGNVDPSLLRKKIPRIAELPFNSDSKMMATQHEINGKSVVFIKGAPEALLKFCDSIYMEESLLPLTEPLRLHVENEIKRMGEAALRVVACGFVNGAFIDGSKGFAPFMHKTILVGLIGEWDPPREDVADSIRQCQRAGIRPVMVTGDHKATGLAIAKTLGISQNKDLTLDGQELDLLSDEELAKKINHIRVFARVHPAQKLRIVEAYQRRNEVVAMTGDGVNDAPALARANVGVAMGISGTEVAKEAAKIIITDDNFTTIVAAIAEGRLVYQNIKKLILFLFVTSIDEVMILFLALALGYPPPLSAVQILWINLVTEGTLTVNLVLEPAEGDEMERPPTPPHQPLLDRSLLSRIPLMALASILATFSWLVYRTSAGAPSALVQTETFTILAFCQWFNVLNCRASLRSAFSRSFHKNPWLLGGLSLGIALQIMVIYWPPLGQFFHTQPIAGRQMLEMGALASLVLWVEELRKVVMRWRATINVKS
ncbi:MAG: cation-translocating P-type ATPase [Pseudobdellovibrionaceae bacterium]